ncbi:MAG: fused MFS/spermidine synthase [Planctomycetes bacterium]|nr:fused MFS/spermidine synthase [Planctomycetota bacterium]
MKLASAAAVFLGAFLLFQVQPMIAKAILPWFGGAPAVWTTCMLFFQAALLAGYAYAHASTKKLAPRRQVVVHLVALAAALVTLPILPDAASVADAALWTDAASAPSDSRSPVLAIVAVLVSTIALPYFVLAATGPLLQAWFARASPGASPYRLYALSNAGSLLGLVSYPFAIEPWLSTRAQAWVWSAAFGAFALVCALAARGAWSAPDVVAERASASPAPTSQQRGVWLALSATASALLLAVTNQMCQEVAVVPLLWVLPLALYLATFVLCFESERWYSRSWNLPVLILSLTVLTQAAALGAKVGIWYGVPIYSLGLFVCCMFCHGELAARRPSAQHLTSFYLTLATGGVLGGAFVAVVAPRIFTGFDELYLALLACGVLALAFVYEPRAQRLAKRRLWHPTLPALIAVVLILGAVFTLRMLSRSQAGSSETRNFFGILRVQDLPAPDFSGAMRYLTHGGTRHGQQYRDDARRREPTTYYGRPSGIGVLLDELASAPPLHVGLVGLGAGVIAAFGRSGDVYRYYEINPSVVAIAERDFTFLADSRATIELVDGDARLALERETDRRFDVLVLDAFSSDAIPLHLLTVEAFELYLARLALNGVLALHLTSRHLDLGPVVAGIAGELGLITLEIATPADDEHALLDARWILVARGSELLARPRLAAAGRAIDLAGKRPLVFTDDCSNLFAVLK